MTKIYSKIADEIDFTEEDMALLIVSGSLHPVNVYVELFHINEDCLKTQTVIQETWTDCVVYLDNQQDKEELENYVRNSIKRKLSDIHYGFKYVAMGRAQYQYEDGTGDGTIYLTVGDNPTRNMMNYMNECVVDTNKRIQRERMAKITRRCAGKQKSNKVTWI